MRVRLLNLLAPLTCIIVTYKPIPAPDSGASPDPVQGGVRGSSARPAHWVLGPGSCTTSIWAYTWGKRWKPGRTSYKHFTSWDCWRAPSRIWGGSYTEHSFRVFVYSVQLISVAQSCLTLCDPMGCSMPGFPVHHQLLEPTQTHVHWVGDAIQPSHPLLSPSPPAFNLSQHQGLFQWVSSSHQMAKVFGASASASIFPMNIQVWFPLGWTGLTSLLSKGLSRSPPTHSSKASILRRSAFFMVQLSHPYMTTGKT